jgi:hypothetical protein
MGVIGYKGIPEVVPRQQRCDNVWLLHEPVEWAPGQLYGEGLGNLQ